MTKDLREKLLEKFPPFLSVQLEGYGADVDDIIAFLEEVRHQELEEIVKEIEKLKNVEDTEREGYDILEKHQQQHCCPGDDAWAGYEIALEEVKSLIAKKLEK